MSLIDELETDRTSNGPRCRLSVLGESDPDLYGEIAAAIAAGYTFAAISRRLRARNVDISDQTLSHHFGKACRCPS